MKKMNRKKTSTELRLKIELVPEPLNGKNLRRKNALGDYRWRELRKALLKERGPSCSICGSAEGPHAHEVWKYEERAKTGKATIVNIEIICRMCHFVHHYGLTTILWDMGRMTTRETQDVRRHFLRVNGCKSHDFKTHADAAFEEWEKRSAKKWAVSYGPYSGMVREAKAARRAKRALHVRTGWRLGVISKCLP